MVQGAIYTPPLYRGTCIQGPICPYIPPPPCIHRPICQGPMCVCMYTCTCQGYMHTMIHIFIFMIIFRVVYGIFQKPFVLRLRASLAMGAPPNTLWRLCPLCHARITSLSVRVSTQGPTSLRAHSARARIGPLLALNCSKTWQNRRIRAILRDNSLRVSSLVYRFYCLGHFCPKSSRDHVPCSANLLRS
jgi:hypothetical protein